MSAPKPAREGILANLAPFDLGPESCPERMFFENDNWTIQETAHCMHPKGHNGDHAGVMSWPQRQP